MRLDPVHAEKLRTGLLRDDSGATAMAHLDIEFMLVAFGRLSAWERGIVTDAILRAAQAKRPSIEQRALLALFLPPLPTVAPESGEVDHG